jgi:hypothetical protein
MSRLNPEKLSVEFREGVTTKEPIIPRHYTLSHSDITAELFLTIGLTYAYDKTNAMRDEVLGEWIRRGDGYIYHVYLYIDGQFGPVASGIRDRIFRRELPLALEAIRYGDGEFFKVHPELNNVPIIVYFISSIPKHNKVENWGTFLDYDITKSIRYDEIYFFRQNTYLLDTKVGDVTGDGVPDEVFLYGNKPDGTEGIFAEDITVVIEDGRTKKTKTITPEFNSGYNPRLFLGDLTKDRIEDIKVSIESGGSGGYGYFYIYSFKNNNLKEIFNFDKYNEEFKYKVDYADLYKVNVGNVMMDKLFILDISYKGYDYLSEYYGENGKLKKPVKGEVLAISALVPVINDEKTNAYDLLAFQRIIGITNSDTLGYIENLLSWNSEKFASTRMVASTPGTNLISPY